MKIDQSTVAMQACHHLSSDSEFSVEIRTSFRSVFDSVSLTEVTSVSDLRAHDAQVLLMFEALLARMLELITGKPQSKVTDLREVLQTGESTIPDNGRRKSTRLVEEEWHREVVETIREHENTEFISTGRIRTADGRTLDFSLELALCRDFERDRKVTDSGKVLLHDPLVINFGGNSTLLSGQRFAFDLDADGKAESTVGLADGSGFLAIDSNGDGCINDGSELFGTRSGNGFADLSRLDEDGNQWLDESDTAFSTLRIWRHEDSGKKTLSTLHDEGVGAIYLGSAETPFSLTDSENHMLAMIRASGIYLREDGSAGTLQQVDLTTEPLA